MSAEEARAKWIARAVGIFLLIGIAIGISQFQLGAGLVWGGLVIAILAVVLTSSDKILNLLATLEGQ